MRNLIIMAITICSSLVIARGGAMAQSGPTSNPVTNTVRQLVQRYQRNVIGAAEAMPAEKYGYHPTDGQISYAKLMSHIAESNFFLCSRIGDLPAPDTKVDEKDGKEKIVTALQASFDFCGQALQKVDDSKLGDQVQMFGGRQQPRAAALIALTNDFADHYSAAAGYLRLNGILPPSAQQQQRPAQGATQSQSGQKPPE